jgi:hypothetical protein
LEQAREFAGTQTLSGDACFEAKISGECDVVK